MSGSTDRLDEIRDALNWEAFGELASRPFEAAKEPVTFDAEVMVKLLFLGRWFRFGEPVLLEEAAENPAIRRFLDSDGGAKLPTLHELVAFRNRLHAEKLLDVLMNTIEGQLRQKRLPTRSDSGGEGRDSEARGDARLIEVVRKENLDRIPGYEIVSLIAKGTMASVYRARREDGGDAALKILHPVHKSREAIARFVTEMKALAALDHPGIARLYGSGTFESEGSPRPYIAMEYVEGRDIARHVQEESSSVPEKTALILSVAETVAYFHGKGVLHRDLKPANILVAEGGRTKILDFGLARVTKELQPSGFRTSTGQLVGAFDYMSPEGTLAQPELIDARTDVYGLGVLAYLLYAGRLPFDFKSKSLPAIVAKIREEPPAALGSIDARCAGGVERIVARCLAKAKEDRFPTANALAAALRDELKV